MTKDTCVQHLYKKKKKIPFQPSIPGFSKTHGASATKEKILTLVIPHAHLHTWKDSSCKSNAHLQCSGGLNRDVTVSALGRWDRRHVTLTSVLKCAEVRRRDAGVEKMGVQSGTRETISGVKVQKKSKNINGRWSVGLEISEDWGNRKRKGEVSSEGSGAESKCC